jgi:hypothetical protein
VTNHIDSTNFVVFVKDDFTVGPNLTLIWGSGMKLR